MNWVIKDLKEMPADNPPKNGMDSVSRGVVKLVETPYGTFPYCFSTIHTYPHISALLRVGDRVWRCPEDNEGCWAWREYDVRT